MIKEYGDKTIEWLIQKVDTLQEQIHDIDNEKSYITERTLAFKKEIKILEKHIQELKDKTRCPPQKSSNNLSVHAFIVNNKIKIITGLIVLLSILGELGHFLYKLPPT